VPAVERYGELEARAILIRSRLRAEPGMSDRALARELGIHHSSVNRIRHELADEGWDVEDEPRWSPDLDALDDLDARCADLERHARQLVHDAQALIDENRRLRRAVGK
jgi:DNA-binding IclR family transcriptional regulator